MNKNIKLIKLSDCEKDGVQSLMKPLPEGTEGKYWFNKFIETNEELLITKARLDKLLKEQHNK